MLFSFDLKLVTGGNMEFDEISEVCPWLEFAHDLGQDVENWPTRRILKTHMSYNEVPKGAKYIYILRDGKDVAVSFYNFLNGWRFQDNNGALFPAFFRTFFMSGHARWFEHVLSWLPVRTHPPNLIDLSSSSIHVFFPF